MKAKPSPLIEFLARPSPLTAIKLAIADHRRGCAPDWEFITQLNKAAEILVRSCNSKGKKS